MAKVLMCSIYDITISKFREPFYAQNEEDAKRAFKYIMSKNNLMMSNPSDFELYKVAEWDDENGIMYMGEKGTVYVDPRRMFKGGEIIHEQGNTGSTL